jgi:arylsulfatase A-like enzyme
MWHNGVQMRPDFRTLAHHFNDAGYHTAYYGKWHLTTRLRAMPTNMRAPVYHPIYRP